MSEKPAKRDSDYLLGTRPEELRRLGFQHRVWARETFDLWSRAGFGTGQTILDLGCGPGFAALDLAHLVGPQGKVVAVDESADFLAHLEHQCALLGLENVECLRADVHELDLGEESLDGAYARWLLCFVEDPEAVVGRVARALKPGARFAVTDYFNYRAFTFAPRSEVFDRIVAAVERSWKLRGGDLAIQGRMPALFAACGLETLEVRNTSRIARPGEPLWSWPRSFFDLFLPTLLEMGLIAEEDRRAFDALWQERSADPTSYLSIPPQIDVIGIKR